MTHEAENDLPEILSEPRELGRPLRWVGRAAAIAAILAAAGGIVLRWHHETEVKNWTTAEAVPAVSLIFPERGSPASQLILPGDIQAWYDAPIYARVNGYLQNWFVDYGARVKAGQILAEIDAPDLDGSFAAAKARLNAVKAQVKVRDAELAFAQTTYDRWRASPKGVVSIQETTSKKGDFESATARVNAAIADVNAAQGEVDRLAALESFKRVIAPFDGVVTERNTDIGALINAGSGVGGGSGPVMFRVADVSRMRIFVQVPQKLSSRIREGMDVDLYLPQYPDKTFKATVATTAGAINMSARTLLVELHAANPDNLLQPGTYAEVHFHLPGDPDILRLPTSALLFRRNGLKVAVVGQDDKVELKSVALGRNLGREVDVLRGLAATDRVINSPPDSLAAGDLVRVVSEPSPSGKQPEVESEPEKNSAADAKSADPVPAASGKKAGSN